MDTTFTGHHLLSRYADSRTLPSGRTLNKRKQPLLSLTFCTGTEAEFVRCAELWMSSLDDDGWPSSNRAHQSFCESAVGGSFFQHLPRAVVPGKRGGRDEL
jgi:hypothetical protein